MRTILKSLGKDDSSLEHVEDRPGHDQRYSLDSTRLRQELGWKPLHSFEQGIEDTVRWYAKNADWWKALADEKTLNATPWKLAW